MIGGTPRRRQLTLAAHLGVARCLLRDQHPADARGLLSPFLLDEARQQGRAGDVCAPACGYLVGLAFAQETLPLPRGPIE